MLPDYDFCSRLIMAQVATTVAEMSSDAAAKLWDDNINRRLFELMHSNNNAEKLGGLLAIGTCLRQRLVVVHSDCF